MNQYLFRLTTQDKKCLQYQDLLDKFINRYESLKFFLENNIEDLNPESTKELIFEIHTNMIFLGKYIGELRIHLLGEKNIKHSYIETMKAYIKAYGL
jgi:hypothetical protein